MLCIRSHFLPFIDFGGLTNMEQGRFSLPIPQDPPTPPGPAPLYRLGGFHHIGF